MLDPPKESGVARALSSPYMVGVKGLFYAEKIFTSIRGYHFYSWGTVYCHRASWVACPYEIFKCTKCVKFLFVLVLLDFRKRTKKRFQKSVSNFLRYEFFLYLIFGRFVEIIRISMYFSQMTKFGHNQYFRKAI